MLCEFTKNQGGFVNILVINGHPDKESFVSALFHKYCENISKNKHNIEMLDLSAMKFDPVLRFGYRKIMEADNEIEKSQELIKWADHFVFFYPIWFGVVPSLLKGWFERVFTPGIAYHMNGFKITKYLKGKTAHLVSTSQTPVFWQNLTGNFEIKQINKVLWFCGIKIIKVDRIGQVVGEYSSPGKRNKFLEHIGEVAKGM